MANKWYKLDNAATMIPSTARGANTRVFRLSCTLKEDVDPDKLQEALDKTVQEFPHLNVSLRKGLFWYYLDPVRTKAKVEEDHLPICAPIYFPGRRNLLYRVSYYGKRINLEMFHVLADGTGGLAFLGKMVTNYLCAVHGIETVGEEHDRSSAEAKNEDAFRHFYEKAKGNKQLGDITTRKAYQIHGTADENLQVHVLEGIVSAGECLELAHRYKTTVGVLLTALLVQAILDDMPVADYKTPVVLQVPVNLRQYFHSETTRNFFGVILVKFDPADYNGTLESILPHIEKSFEKQLQQERIRQTMNSYSGLEHNLAISMVPVFIKDLVISGYSAQATKGTTATISNLGKIRMPDSVYTYVDYFSAFMTARNLQVCIATYADKLVVGTASAFTDHRVMHRFFRRLKDHGIEALISTNDFDEREKQPESGSAHAASKKK